MINPSPGSSRRSLITTFLPACALACAGGAHLLARAATGDGVDPSTTPAHKFDAPFDGPLSHRKLFQIRYGEMVQLAAALRGEMGAERLIPLLERTATERMAAYGRQQAEQASERTLRSYTEQFRDPERYGTTLTMEVVEDSDSVFELKVTECLWARTFLDAEAGDIGHAWVCHGDFAWAQGFHPSIELVRTQTLMQGHPCCNHRYVWKA